MAHSCMILQATRTGDMCVIARRMTMHTLAGRSVAAVGVAARASAAAVTCGSHGGVAAWAEPPAPWAPRVLTKALVVPVRASCAHNIR